MSQEPKKRNRKSVANPQQFSPEELPDAISVVMMEYIKKTEIPILSEFCAENEIYEEFALAHAETSKKLQIAIKILENKKRAALERKIYTAELNATIGAHLMKSWAETVAPESPPRFRDYTLDELTEAGLSSEEQIIYCDILRKITGGKKSLN